MRKEWKQYPESRPKSWTPMLPMSYIGTSVPVWRDVCGLPAGPLEHCNIAGTMANLSADPELYFNGNMDQVR